MTQDYIKTLRQKVGHEPIILNFAGGILANDQNEILLQKDLILMHGVCLVVL